MDSLREFRHGSRSIGSRYGFVRRFPSTVGMTELPSVVSRQRFPRGFSFGAGETRSPCRGARESRNARECPDGEHVVHRGIVETILSTVLWRSRQTKDRKVELRCKSVVAVNEVFAVALSKDDLGISGLVLSESQDKPSIPSYSAFRNLICYAASCPSSSGR